MRLLYWAAALALGVYVVWLALHHSPVAPRTLATALGVLWLMLLIRVRRPLAKAVLLISAATVVAVLPLSPWVTGS